MDAMHRAPDDEHEGSTNLEHGSSLGREIPGHAAAWGFGAANDASPADNTAPSNSSHVSLFSSGLPAAFTTDSPDISVDSSRAHVVPASSSNSSRPLAVLASSTVAMTKRAARLRTEQSATPLSTQIPQAQKDTDDPSTPLEDPKPSTQRGLSYSTPTTLSRLFAGDTTMPSRTTSYVSATGPLYVRSTSAAVSLPDHLYSRGLLEGRHSDITVIAFGQKYALHRLILDRAPFFTTALSEPWMESHSKDVTLHPEQIDHSITQTAFELAIKKLYGCDISKDADAEAIGLFATGCWLEMQDLIDTSIESILRQMGPETLSPLIRLVTSNYYGRSGDRILASAKSMLCRDGWEMALRYWDGIPGDVIREIVAGDGFYVHSEWDRWVLGKRLLDRRLRQAAVEEGLIERGQKPIPKAPDSMRLMAVRFDAVYRQNSMTVNQHMGDSQSKWLALYTNPDIEPLLVLLDEGIHYIHMDFEQLDFIRNARDVLGLPVMPERVISNALWQGLALRQKVLNADGADQELGLTQQAPKPATTDAATTSTSKGKQKAGICTPDEEEDELDSGSWDGNGRPRKFWIPSSDCNIVLGNGADPVVTTSSSFQRHANRLSATMQPEDAQWATDFASSPSTLANPNTRTENSSRPISASGSNAGQPKPIAFTEFPPFRFSAEFPNPRVLKEKKRVYSRTVSYAGSLWNIYIQKVRSAKNVQLGVYLHRAKEREQEEVLAGGGLPQQNGGSVDERIGQLEREMLLRSERRERRRNSRMAFNDQAGEEDTSGSGGDPDATLVSTGSRNSLVSGSRRSFNINRHRNAFAQLPRHSISGSCSHGQRLQDESQCESCNRLVTSPPSDGEGEDLDYEYRSALFSTEEHDTDESDEDELERAYPNPSLSLPGTRKSRAAASALPPFVDGRPTIKTYFKIYSPSKGGRMLSVYESAPDRFNFSQSWGWKSSTLMLDEVVLTGVGSDGLDTDGAGDGKKKASDGKLRFMVVIGNL